MKSTNDGYAQFRVRAREYIEREKMAGRTPELDVLIRMQRECMTDAAARARDSIRIVYEEGGAPLHRPELPVEKAQVIINDYTNGYYGRSRDYYLDYLK